jgi:glycine oxidase
MADVDVAVIGGGLIGLSVAWRARERGLSVCLLERGELGGATTHVAAGMLAPVAEADPGERALLALALDSAARWPAFAAALEAASGLCVGYRTCGTLLLARDRDEAEHVDRELALRDALGLRAGRLLPSQARRLEPALAPTLRGAAQLPDDHAVDPRLVAAALGVAAGRLGAVLRPRTDVTGIDVVAGRATGVTLAGGERVGAGQVVVAAGAWAGAGLGLPAAARVPVRPVKGQLLRLRDSAGPGLCERVLRFDGGYLVPRGDGRYLLGATMEELGFDTAITAGGLFGLLRDASELVPGVLELEVEEALAGLRPGTPDNAPILGRCGAVEGLLWAAGHHRNGVLLAPVTADLLAADLAGDIDGARIGGGGLDARAFAPDRFAPAGVPA